MIVTQNALGKDVLNVMQDMKLVETELAGNSILTAKRMDTHGMMTSVYTVANAKTVSSLLHMR